MILGSKVTCRLWHCDLYIIILDSAPTFKEMGNEMQGGLKHKDHFHGSDLEKIEAFYGIKKEDITSFSANVNPLGISPKMAETLRDHIRCIEAYPDREYTALKASIARYVGCDAGQILVGNGTTELITHVTSYVSPKKALIVGPTYSEYEHAVTLCGGSSVYFPLREEDDFVLDTMRLTEKLTDDIDLLFLCNPNNPTGTVIRTSETRKILNACMEHGIFVCADETYIEFAENPSGCTAVPLANDYNNLIVLRGVSKFFAAPGLRLGYAITGNSDLLSYVASQADPWTINAYAELAGTVMFSDEEYIKETRDLIAKERERLYRFFQESKRFKPYPPGANFLLLKITEDGLTAHELFDRCIKQGLMIRDCATFPFLDERYLRFCFLTPEQNQRLVELLIA